MSLPYRCAVCGWAAVFPAHESDTRESYNQRISTHVSTCHAASVSNLIPSSAPAAATLSDAQLQPSTSPPPTLSSHLAAPSGSMSNTVSSVGNTNMLHPAHRAHSSSHFFANSSLPVPAMNIQYNYSAQRPLQHQRGASALVDLCDDVALPVPTDKSRIISRAPSPSSVLDPKFPATKPLNPAASQLPPPLSRSSHHSLEDLRRASSSRPSDPQLISSLSSVPTYAAAEERFLARSDSVPRVSAAYSGGDSRPSVPHVKSQQPQQYAPSSSPPHAQSRSQETAHDRTQYTFDDAVKASIYLSKYVRDLVMNGEWGKERESERERER